jgi:hypothetical protein
VTDRDKRSVLLRVLQAANQAERLQFGVLALVGLGVGIFSTATT